MKEGSFRRSRDNVRVGLRKWGIRGKGKRTVDFLKLVGVASARGTSKLLKFVTHGACSGHPGTEFLPSLGKGK